MATFATTKFFGSQALPGSRWGLLMFEGTSGRRSLVKMWQFCGFTGWTPETMTTAARPTFEPARGGSGKGEGDLSAMSKQYSSRDLPSHTRLKYRCSRRTIVSCRAAPEFSFEVCCSKFQWPWMVRTYPKFFCFCAGKTVNLHPRTFTAATSAKNLRIVSELRGTKEVTGPEVRNLCAVLFGSSKLYKDHNFQSMKTPFPCCVSVARTLFLSIRRIILLQRQQTTSSWSDSSCEPGCWWPSWRGKILFVRAEGHLINSVPLYQRGFPFFSLRDDQTVLSHRSLLPALSDSELETLWEKLSHRNLVSQQVCCLPPPILRAHTELCSDRSPSPKTEIVLRARHHDKDALH